MYKNFHVAAAFQSMNLCCIKHLSLFTQITSRPILAGYLILASGIFFLLVQFFLNTAEALLLVHTGCKYIYLLQWL